MERLVWLAVLSSLISSTAASDCAVGTSAASGTCTAVATVASVASIFVCGATAGIGCGLSVAAISMTGICGVVTGNIDCESGDVGQS